MIISGIVVFVECIDPDSDLVGFDFKDNFNIYRWQCDALEDIEQYRMLHILKLIFIHGHFEFISINCEVFIFWLALITSIFMAWRYRYFWFLLSNIIAIVGYCLAVLVWHDNDYLVQPWVLTVFFVGLHQASRFAHF